MFKFDDISLKEESVQIGSDQFILREATLGIATKYRNYTFNNAEIDPTGKRGNKFKDVMTADTILLQMCLFRVSHESRGGSVEKTLEPVEMDFIHSMPSRISEPLIDWIKKQSNLVEQDDLNSLQKKYEDIKAQLEEIERLDAEGKTPEGNS
jgi:hypothetical protein